MAKKKKSKVVKTKKSKKSVLPLGVKLISIWYYVKAAIALLMGVLIMIFGAPIVSIIGEYGLIPASFVGLIQGILVFGGLMLVVLAIITYLIGKALAKGKNWAKILVIIFAVFGVIGSLSSFPVGIVGLAIDGLVIWYLGFNKEGKGYFS